jgi:hypothetical protein
MLLGTLASKKRSKRRAFGGLEFASVMVEVPEARIRALKSFGDRTCGRVQSGSAKSSIGRVILKVVPFPGFD